MEKWHFLANNLTWLYGCECWCKYRSRLITKACRLNVYVCKPEPKLGGELVRFCSLNDRELRYKEEKRSVIVVPFMETSSSSKSLMGQIHERRFGSLVTKDKIWPWDHVTCILTSDTILTWTGRLLGREIKPKVLLKSMLPHDGCYLDGVANRWLRSADDRGDGRIDRNSDQTLKWRRLSLMAALVCSW